MKTIILSIAAFFIFFNTGLPLWGIGILAGIISFGIDYFRKRVLPHPIEWFVVCMINSIGLVYIIDFAVDKF